MQCFFHRSSFKFSHFVDILTEEESEEVMKEKNMREAAFNSLAARDVSVPLTGSDRYKCPFNWQPEM